MISDFYRRLTYANLSGIHAKHGKFLFLFNMIAALIFRAYAASDLTNSYQMRVSRATPDSPPPGA